MTAPESSPLFTARDSTPPATKPTTVAAQTCHHTAMVAAAPPVEPTASGAGVADWSPFGLLIPVLAGSSGAGASTFTAIAVDVLQQAGRCALAIDTAEPSRSGLATAAPVAGSDIFSPVDGVDVRYSWRGYSLLAQLEPTTTPAAGAAFTSSLAPTPTPALAPDVLPSITPLQWLPPEGLRPLHVTLVDLGQQWSASTPSALRDAGAWLQTGAPDGPRPWPVLVVRATRPSLMAAETALARLDRWIHTGHAVGPARLVVMAGLRRC
jgi:hypothetical protein